MTAEEINKMPIIGYDETASLVGKDQKAIDMAMSIQKTLLMREICFQIATWNETVLPLLAKEKERNEQRRREEEEYEKSLYKKS